MRISMETAVKKRTTFYWVLLALVALGGLSSGCSAVAPNEKPASTATAVGAIYDEIEKGNIKIEVDTDTAPIP